MSKLHPSLRVVRRQGCMDGLSRWKLRKELIPSDLFDKIDSPARYTKCIPQSYSLV